MRINSKPANNQEQEKSGNHCESPCHDKKIPLSLVLLDNIPTIILFALGTAIICRISWIGAIIFVIYALASIVLFWARICPYCHHYGTYACPCGYGALSAKFFRKRNDQPFKKVFKQNIGIQFPNWFVPFGVAIYLLITQYSTGLLVLTIAFCLIGFVLIPLVSKLVGCKNCAIKEDCPWMKK